MYGHFLTKVRPKSSRASARPAPPRSPARHLGCETGEPLLRIDRLYFDAEDTPVELAVSYFDPERYSYRVKLRRRAR